MKIQLSDPSGKVYGFLEEVGEVRFGPSYYRLLLPPFDFGGRIFGHHYLWSSDTRYLVVQEWLSSDYYEGPFTELLIIDLASELQCGVSRACKGFIEPLRFELPLLIYRKNYLGLGESHDYEIAFEKLDRWVRISKS